MTSENKTTKNKVRIVTATSLFDGHDASINIMRRIMQDQGAEVIHLGHNRCVQEVVVACLQEGVQGVAVSSYQGGHLEYFKYLRDLLDQYGAEYIRIFGGGGGVITLEEKKELESYGISRIFHPNEGRKLGLEGMIQFIMKECDFDPLEKVLEKNNSQQSALNSLAHHELGLTISFIERKETDYEPNFKKKFLYYLKNSLSNSPHLKNKCESLDFLFNKKGWENNKKESQEKKDFLSSSSGTDSHQTETKNFLHQHPFVLGITGTGGSGKSSLTDEIIQRFLNLFPQIKIGVFCVDPTKQKTGGALLGDRIRMNCLQRSGVFMRSFASRSSGSEISSALPEVIRFFKKLDFDLLIVESSGIGQSSSKILEVSDLSLYVMTSEFGAQSQLEKIDMIDLADLIAINKADRRGSQDAYRDVQKQYKRSRKLFDNSNSLPVYLTQSSHFNDKGVNELFFNICQKLNEKTELQGKFKSENNISKTKVGSEDKVESKDKVDEFNVDQKEQNQKILKTQNKRRIQSVSPKSISWLLSEEQKNKLKNSYQKTIVPFERQNYLAQVVKTVRDYRENVENMAQHFSLLGNLEQLIKSFKKDKNFSFFDKSVRSENISEASSLSRDKEDFLDFNIHQEEKIITNSPEQSGFEKKVGPTESMPELSGKSDQLQNYQTLISNLENFRDQIRKNIPKECMIFFESYKTIQKEYRQSQITYQVRNRDVNQNLTYESLCGLNIPRVALPQFSDGGDQYRYLSLENVPGRFPFTAGVYPLKRTEEEPTRMFAGEGPPEKTNARFHYLSKQSRVKRLSTAFDSVTLYGEDPHLRPDIYGKVGESGVSVSTLEDMKRLYEGFDLCDKNTSVSMTINGPAPLILAFFMNTALDQQVEKKEKTLGRKLSSEEWEEVQKQTLQNVRGTVQADILKEDQGQNTCIFSIDFALKMMGDVQEYFIKKGVRNFYSVSISGYHIAEAGANPITQLAFTLSNAFTFVEYYLHRGFKIDDFAPNLSFFFSNGLDPEYTVMGRVARRIWAIVMRDLYGANERSQKLKYHIQTSGRSLHAQEMSFNDIRTTLQAFLAVSDQCNSLHTNAFDEALTTPTKESVRKAQAIQMIINKEFGLNKNENPLQGSYFCQWLTDQVEKAVLEEFLRLNERGGVLGAMETQYQRSKIQEESLYYEHLKHSGELPLVGVNTFLDEEKQKGHFLLSQVELARSTSEEKRLCLRRNQEFKKIYEGYSLKAIEQLKQAALQGDNIFEVLMEVSRVCTLGEISQALYEVGGQYRRNL